MIPCVKDFNIAVCEIHLTSLFYFLLRLRGITGCPPHHMDHHNGGMVSPEERGNGSAAKPTVFNFLLPQLTVAYAFSLAGVDGTVHGAHNPARQVRRTGIPEKRGNWSIALHEMFPAVDENLLFLLFLRVCCCFLP